MFSQLHFHKPELKVFTRPGHAIFQSRTFVLAVCLDLNGDRLVSLAISDATQAKIENSGQILADGGSVVLSAAAARDAVSEVVNTAGIHRGIHALDLAHVHDAGTRARQLCEVIEKERAQ